MNLSRPAKHQSDRHRISALDLLLLGEGLSGVMLLMWGFLVLLPTTNALSGSVRYTLLLDLFSWFSDPEIPTGLLGIFGGLAMCSGLMARHSYWRFHERWTGRVACAGIWLMLSIPMIIAAPHVVGGWLAFIAVCAHVVAARKERITTVEGGMPLT